MKAALLRLARILVGQLIGLAINVWGNINVPIIGMTIGALVSAIAKYIRDKYPKNPILEWLPL